MEHFEPADTSAVDVMPTAWAVLILCSALLIVEIVVGIFGNIMICFLVYKNRFLRTPANALLVNLAIADLATSITCSPLLFATLHAQPQKTVNSTVAKFEGSSYLLAGAVHVSYALCATVQLLTLTFISYERFQAIAKPFDRIQRVRRVKTNIALSWVLAFVNCFISGGAFRGDLEVDVLKVAPLTLTLKSKFILYVFVPFSFFCVLLILFIYFMILHMVQKHVKQTTFRLKRKAKVTPCEPVKTAGSFEKPSDMSIMTESVRLKHNHEVSPPTGELQLGQPNPLPNKPEGRSSNQDDNDLLLSMRRLNLVPVNDRRKRNMDNLTLSRGKKNIDLFDSQSLKIWADLTRSRSTGYLNTNFSYHDESGEVWRSLKTPSIIRQTSCLPVVNRKNSRQDANLCNEKDGLLHSSIFIEKQHRNEIDEMDNGYKYKQVQIDSQDTGNTEYTDGDVISLYRTNETATEVAQTSNLTDEQKNRDDQQRIIPRLSRRKITTNSIKLTEKEQYGKEFNLDGSQLKNAFHAGTNTCSTASQHNETQWFIPKPPFMRRGSLTLIESDFLRQSKLEQSNYLNEHSVMPATSPSGISEEKVKIKSEQFSKYSNVKNGKTEKGSPPVIEVCDMDGGKVAVMAAKSDVVGSICVMSTANKERGKRRVEAKTAKVAAIVICAFLICWLPFPIVVVVGRTQRLNTMHHIRLTSLDEWFVVALSLAILGAAINPIAYGIVNKQFRNEIRKLFKSWGKK